MIVTEEEYNKQAVIHKKLSKQLYDLEVDLIRYENIRDADKREEQLQNGYKIDRDTGEVVGTTEHTKFMCNLEYLIKRGDFKVCQENK